MSNRGRVRRVGGHILKPQVHSKGYRKISLGRKHQPYMHFLVAEAFIGPRPAKHDVDHLDFNRAHNCVGNLRYLPSITNALRWNGRAEDGRILWLCEYDKPEDYTPMTEQERDEIYRGRNTRGW